MSAARTTGRPGACACGECDVAGVWEHAVAGGCSRDLWRVLARERALRSPDDAVAVYRRLLDRTIDLKNDGAYREAIELLAELHGQVVPHGPQRAGRPDPRRPPPQAQPDPHARRPAVACSMPVNGWDRGTLGELRGAVHRREGAAVVAALEGRSLEDVLQLAGDGLLAARAQGVPGADALAARCAALLRERRLAGDAELADVLEDRREDDLRPLAATSTS